MLKVDRSGAHPTWTGMEGRSGREVPLDDVWVHDNFAPWFIQNVTDCFKHVPAGKAAASPEHRVAQTGLFGGFDLGGVPVAWQQGDNDCCVPYGAASASDVAQFRDAKGKLLSEHFAPLAGMEVADAMMHLHDHVQSSVPGWDAHFLRLPHNPLADRCDGLTLLQLEDMGGGVAHVVTAVRDLVFDANQPSAVPLSAEGLSSCCLAGDFNSVVRALRLEPGKNALKAMRRAGREEH